MENKDNRSNLTLDQIAEALNGTLVPLYGISEGHTLAEEEWECNFEEAGLIKVGVHHLQVMLDPSDGYRSHCGGIYDLVSLDGYDKLEFFPEPVAQVRIRKIDIKQEHPLDCSPQGYWGCARGWEFVDEDNHIWLSVGTENYDDWYPCFFMRWHPKAPEPDSAA